MKIESSAYYRYACGSISIHASIWIENPIFKFTHYRFWEGAGTASPRPVLLNLIISRFVTQDALIVVWGCIVRPNGALKTLTDRSRPRSGRHPVGFSARS